MSNRIDRAIIELQNTLSSLHSRACLLRDHKADVQKVIDTIAATVGDEHYLYVSTSGSSERHDENGDCIPEVIVGVSLYNLDGLRYDPASPLTKLFDALPDADMTTHRDWAANLNRDYSLYYYLSPTATLRVFVQAYVRDDSPTCRKVVVKMKTRVADESEYAIVCD